MVKCKTCKKDMPMIAVREVYYCDNCDMTHTETDEITPKEEESEKEKDQE